MAKSRSARKNMQVWYKGAVLLFLLLATGLTICACNSTEKKVVGIWVQTSADQVGSVSLENAIKLNADGTFYLAYVRQGNYDAPVGSLRGTYEIKDSTITCIATQVNAD